MLLFYQPGQAGQSHTTSFNPHLYDQEQTPSTESIYFIFLNKEPLTALCAVKTGQKLQYIQVQNIGKG